MTSKKPCLLLAIGAGIVAGVVAGLDAIQLGYSAANRGPIVGVATPLILLVLPGRAIAMPDALSGDVLDAAQERCFKP